MLFVYSTKIKRKYIRKDNKRNDSIIYRSKRKKQREKEKEKKGGIIEKASIRFQSMLMPD